MMGTYILIIGPKVGNNLAMAYLAKGSILNLLLTHNSRYTDKNVFYFWFFPIIKIIILGAIK
ncbi:MAG TPA: hypothetical protein DE045_04580 [Oceanospirillaceae bacterium]|nr:hypothetical protein [Oceanospirillaceae bacterium]